MLLHLLTARIVTTENFEQNFPNPLLWRQDSGVSAIPDRISLKRSQADFLRQCLRPENLDTHIVDSKLKQWLTSNPLCVALATVHLFQPARQHQNLIEILPEGARENTYAAFDIGAAIIPALIQQAPPRLATEYKDIELLNTSFGKMFDALEYIKLPGSSRDIPFANIYDVEAWLETCSGETLRFVAAYCETARSEIARKLPTKATISGIHAQEIYEGIRDFTILKAISKKPSSVPAETNSPPLIRSRRIVRGDAQAGQALPTD